LPEQIVGIPTTIQIDDCAHRPALVSGHPKQIDPQRRWKPNEERELMQARKRTP